MKEIHGSYDRDRHTVTTFTSGNFAYTLEPNYGNLPDGFDLMMFPSGCCDDEDNLFLTSRNLDHPIVMLDAEGNYVRDFGKGLFAETHGICVTPEGTLLCADTGLHVIRELTKTGEHIRDLGTLGKPSDSGYDGNAWRRMQRRGFMIPTDVPYKDNASWVFYEGVLSIKRAAEPFNRPTGVCVAPNGNIYVSDGYGNAAVHRFTRDGELIRTWGGPGHEPGKFIVPHCIWADKENRIWVGDREGNKINIFDEDGELIGCVTDGLYQPTEIFADEDYIYVVERGGGLTIFNMDMEIEVQLGYFNSPIRAHGMCGDSKGNLYFMPLTTYDCHYLMKLSPCR